MLSYLRCCLPCPQITACHPYPLSARFASSPASTAEITGQDPESAKVEALKWEGRSPAS
jgi:hypothetical protein